MAGIGKKAQAKASTTDKAKKDVKTAVPPKAAAVAKSTKAAEVATNLMAKAAQSLMVDERPAEDKPVHHTAVRSPVQRELTKGPEDASLAARLANLRNAPPSQAETLSARILGGNAVQSENRGISRRDALKARMLK